MPVFEPSLSYEYVIDIGDTLDIEIFGSFNSSEKIVISNDGSIVIKGIGAIQVVGLTLGDASKKYLMLSPLSIQVLRPTLNLIH